MATCTVNFPGGVNNSCRGYLSEAVAALIIPADKSFLPPDLDGFDAIRSMLQEDLNAYLIEFNGTEPTAAEPTTETTGFGKNIITGEGTPSLIGYAETSAHDFREMLQSFKGGSYGVIFILADGNILATFKPDGTIYGFNTQVWANSLGVPGRENKFQQYRVHFNFYSSREFDRFYIKEPIWGIDDIFLAMPVGLSMVPQSAFVSPTLSVQVYYRGTDNMKSGALTADILRSRAGITPIITFTDNTGGDYSVDVQKDDGVGGTTPLEPGDYVEFRAAVQNANVYEELSNSVRVAI